MMAVSGNTRYPEYRELVQQYEFQKIKAWTRRSITPMDIDGRYLIHSRIQDAYLWFELGTEGKRPNRHQMEAYDGLLRNRPNRDLLIMAQHAPLQPAHFPDDMKQYALRMWDVSSRVIVQTEWFPNGKDKHIGWWIDQWFRYVEEQGPNHFITAFRQAAKIYPTTVEEPWRDSLKEGVS